MISGRSFFSSEETSNMPATASIILYNLFIFIRQDLLTHLSNEINIEYRKGMLPMNTGA